MLSDVKKQNVMRIWSYQTLPMEIPVAGIFNMPSTFQFSWEMLFFEREIQKFLKLLEISCLQVRNSKLIIIIMLHILHSYMLVCITTIVEVSFKIFLVWLLFFVDLCSQKSYLSHWTSIFMYASLVTSQEEE